MTFKLPAIPQGIERRFSKMNVRAPLAEANTRMAMFKSIGVPVAEAAQSYVQRETKREIDNESLFMVDGVANFTADFSEVSNFDRDKVTNPHIIEAMDRVDQTKQILPGYRVFSEASYLNQKALLEQSTGRITDSNARGMFQNKYAKIGVTDYAQDTVRAVSKQKAHILKESMAAYKNAIGQGKTQEAILVASKMDIGREQKNALVDEANLKGQTETLNGILRSDDPAVLQKGLTMLGVGVPGLSIKGTRVWEDQMKTRIQRLKVSEDRKQAEIARVASIAQQRELNQTFFNGSPEDKRAVLNELEREGAYPGLTPDQKRMYRRLLETDINGGINQTNRKFINDILLDKEATQDELELAQDMLYESSKYFPNMKEEDRYSMYQRILSKRNSMLSSNANVANADRKLKVKHAKQMMFNFQNGDPVDMGAWDVAIKDLAFTNGGLVEEMRWTQEIQPTILSILTTHNNTEQDMAVDVWLDEAKKDPSLKKVWASARLRDAVSENRKERARDTIAWGKKTGAVNPPPINYEKGKLAESLAAQLPAAVHLQGKFKTFTGILDDRDMQIFVDAMMNDKDPTRFLAAAKSAFGDMAPAFYDQMKKFGSDAGPIAVSAELSDLGPQYKGTVDTIRKGATLKDDPLVKQWHKDHKDEVQLVFLEKYGSAFGENTLDRKAYFDAYMAHVSVTQAPDLSAQEVAGGMVSYKGNWIINPDPGNLDSQGFTEWITGLPDSWYDNPKNIPKGSTKEQFKESLESGQVIPVGLHRGAFYLKHSDAGFSMDAEVPGKRYILQYDKNIETKAQRKRRDKVEATLRNEQDRAEYIQEFGVPPIEKIGSTIAKPFKDFAKWFPGKETKGFVVPKM